MELIFGKCLIHEGPIYLVWLIDLNNMSHVFSNQENLGFKNKVVQSRKKKTQTIWSPISMLFLFLLALWYWIDPRECGIFELFKNNERDKLKEWGYFVSFNGYYLKYSFITIGKMALHDLCCWFLVSTCAISKLSRSLFKMIMKL